MPFKFSTYPQIQTSYPHLYPQVFHEFFFVFLLRFLLSQKPVDTLRKNSYTFPHRFLLFTTKESY
jgi:hypothetical protein